MSGKASGLSCCGQVHERGTRAGGAPRGGKDCFSSCRAGQYSSRGGYGRCVIVPAAGYLCTEPLVESKSDCKVNGLHGLRAHVGRHHHAFEHEARSRTRARSRAVDARHQLRQVVPQACPKHAGARLRWGDDRGRGRDMWTGRAATAPRTSARQALRWNAHVRCDVHMGQGLLRFMSGRAVQQPWRIWLVHRPCRGTPVHGTSCQKQGRLQGQRSLRTASTRRKTSPCSRTRGSIQAACSVSGRRCTASVPSGRAASVPETRRGSVGTGR